MASRGEDGCAGRAQLPAGEGRAWEAASGCLQIAGL